MSTLGFVDKELIASFFGFRAGFIFTYLDHGYNKNTTRNLILDGTGIDIYSHPDFAELSQEKCMRLIWEKCDDNTVGRLLKVMLDYYDTIRNWDWDSKEERDYWKLRELQKKLMENAPAIPAADTRTLRAIKDDIERNCNNGTPELATDRLHTFAVHFFRKLCLKHDIKYSDKEPLNSLVGKVKRWYEENAYFASDFTTEALGYSVRAFEKFNTVRNDQSAAHDNELLNKAEAAFSVRIVSETLSFIDGIEKIRDDELNKRQSLDDLLSYITDLKPEDLPF